jgi:hypothetical protein
MPVVRCKWKEGSRNFVDYYDCRPIFPIHPDRIDYEAAEIIKSLIKTHFNETRNIVLNNKVTEFNYYKNKRFNIDRSFQFFPHDDDNYNAIVYLDKVSSGGTAFYNIPRIENNETLNLLYDVSKFPRMVIKAKPNRLVIFDGTVMHGGFIEDHNKYVNDWRINQVMFFKSYE